MTYEAKLKEFYNSFGIPAYPSTAVPDEKEVSLPYIVYEVPYGNFEDIVSGTVNIYYHTTLESIPNKKAEEIKKAIGSGITLKYDDGIVTLYKGTPEQVNLSYQDEPETKLRSLNVTYQIVRKEL